MILRCMVAVVMAIAAATAAAGCGGDTILASGDDSTDGMEAEGAEDGIPADSTTDAPDGEGWDGAEVPDETDTPDSADDGPIGDVGSVCGDGVVRVDLGEDCDDGNDVSGDGCEADCGWSCTDLPECDDGDPCTRDHCLEVPAGRRCVHIPATGATCDDGVSCTHSDRCGADATCGGTPYECTPGLCDESSSCDGDGGCVSVRASAGTGCEDGDPCSSPDACDGAGICAPGPNVCTCIGDGDCFAHEDGDACNGTLRCTGGFCVLDPSTVVTCPEDPPPCRAFVCTPAVGSCALVNAPDGTPCDDGLFCTLVESCLDGEIVSGGPRCPAVACIRGCNEVMDLCLPAPAGTVCAGGPDSCVLDGVCTGGSIPCPGATFRPPSHACRPSTGPCDPAESCSGTSARCPADVLLPLWSLCDDGDPSTGPDVCDGAGACVGSLPQGDKG